jgi:hypothetical protein
MEKITVRTLASVVGQITSMSLALDAITRHRTRAVYADINCSRAWSNKLCLSVDSLKFWLNGMNFLYEKPIGLN